MAHRSDADPSNLWGNARGGSAVQTQLKSREGQAHDARGTSPSSLGGSCEAQARDAVNLSHVSRAYTDRHGTSVQALAEVSLQAARGGVLAVVGPSGCGKT